MASNRTLFGILIEDDADSGTAAVEFALFLPFLMLLLTGVVELGFSAYEAMQVSNAVEGGALYVAQNAPSYATSTGWTSAAIASIVSATVAGATLPSTMNTLTATPAPILFCGCPTATGVTNAGAPTAGSCASLATCSSGFRPGLYVQVKASLNHMVILPTSWGLPTTFTATAVIRTN